MYPENGLTHTVTHTGKRADGNSGAESSKDHAFLEQTIPEAGFFLSVGSAVVKNNPQFLIASKSCEKQRKTAYFRRNKLFSGAAGRIRTADLILTKWLKAPKVLLSSAFGAFLFQRCVVFGAFRSIVSIRSFPRVGHGVGQTTLDNTLLQCRKRNHYKTSLQRLPPKCGPKSSTRQREHQLCAPSGIFAETLFTLFPKFCGYE